METSWSGDFECHSQSRACTKPLPTNDTRNICQEFDYRSNTGRCVERHREAVNRVYERNGGGVGGPVDPTGLLERGKDALARYLFCIALIGVTEINR